MTEYVLPQVLKKYRDFIINGDGHIGYDWYRTCVDNQYVSFPWAAVFFVGANVAISDTGLCLSIRYLWVIVDFSGPLQTGLRDLGMNTAIPSVRNIWGAGLSIVVGFLSLRLFIGASSVFITRSTRD